MRDAVSLTLLPPERPSSERGGNDAAFSAILLVLAFGLLALARLDGPERFRPLFATLPLHSPWDLLVLGGAVAMAVLLHEAGHLLASLALGFDVLGASFGPLHLQCIPGDRKIYWSGRSWATASISAIPASPDGWRGQLMSVVAAGPLATLLSGLYVASWYGVHPAAHPVDPVALLFQLAFVQVSLLLFVLGLIPNHRLARQQNDARLFIDLLLDNQNAQSLKLLVELKQQSLRGVRPQNYPSSLLERMARFRGRPESALQFAQAILQWAIDCEQLERADAWDTFALSLADKCSARTRNAALAASACFDVLYREDWKAAAEKFRLVDCAALFPTCVEERCRAAAEFAMGRTHKAAAHILRAQYAIPRGNEYYAFERMLLAKLHMRVLMATAAARPRMQTASA